MKPRFRLPATAMLALVASGTLLAAPSVFPTGTTVNDASATWAGYTVLSPLRPGKVTVIDMDGRVVKEWAGYDESAGGPARILPGGEVIAAEGARPGHQESLALVQRAFDGTERWRLSHNEQVTLPDGRAVDALRQHHDWQRSDFPAGYYSPEAKPASTGARTLVMTHVSRVVPAIAEPELEDDRILEFDAQGKVTWEWVAGDHIDEFGFDTAARDAIRAAAMHPPAGPPRPAAAPAAGGAPPPRRAFDWLHLNSVTYVGPNRWFDAGDRRFAPDNVIISSRNASFLAIVARDGKVVWRLGPDFRERPEWLALGQTIGQHHAHLIPKGLPGAGNLLVFDNGGASGYGTPSALAPTGNNTMARATSRVLEFDPVTFKRVWAYNAEGFYATNISGAQRLVNGNTLITEGPSGRVFEVTSAGRIVWEFVNPEREGGRGAIYRAYWVPYDWLPQVPRK